MSFDFSLKLFLGISLGLVVLAYIWSKIELYQVLEQVRVTWPRLKPRITNLKPEILILRTLIYLLVTILVLWALFFPPGEEITQEAELKGVDVLFVVDVSLSMNATDATPNRLGRFKEILLNLLPELEGNRLGILVFAGTPFYYCPMTTDLNAFADYVRGLDVDMVGDKGTDLARSFQKAKTILDSSKLLRNRILVFASDGEDSEEPELPDWDVPFMIWGIGDSDGAPIYYSDPDTKTAGFVTVQGVLVPNSGFPDVVYSVPNPEYLQRIARKNQGSFHNLTWDARGAYQLIDKIDEMEKNTLEKATHVIREEKLYSLLLPASLLLLLDFSLLEFLLFRRRKIGPGPYILFVLFIILLPSSFLRSESILNPLGDRVKSGVQEFQSENFGKAADTFRNAEEEFGEDPRLAFNRGTSLLGDRKFGEAIPLLEKALNSSDPSLKSKVYYNLGKAYNAMGQKKIALDSFRKALDLDPNFENARKNMELLFQAPRGDSGPGNPNQGNRSRSNRSGETDEGNSGSGSNSGQGFSPPVPNSSNPTTNPDPNSNDSPNSGNKKERGNRDSLSPEEADQIMDSLNPERIQRRKSKSFLQPRRDKFW